MPYTPSPISGLQFEEQQGLFPEHDPAMRRRQPAEMTPEQFREQPDTFHHATYHEEMPKGPTTREAAGIHLGTLQSAMDRIDTFGERNTARRDEFGRPDFSADIHARRLHPSVKTATFSRPEELRYGIDKIMEGTPQRPRRDLGHRWDRTDDDHGWGDDRRAHEFGEYYENQTEDMGSVSIRVPDAGYLDSHRDTIDRAIRRGDPVHPVNKGLIRDFGGKGIDEPLKYMSGSQFDDDDDDHWKTERINAYGANENKDAMQPMLLPYKLRANRDYQNNHGGFTHTDSSVDPRTGTTHSRAAVTFAATYDEAKAMSTAPAHEAETVPGRRTLSSDEVQRGRRPAARPAAAPWRLESQLGSGHPALSSQFNR